MPLVGDLAPDFALRDQDKEPVTLSDLRGGPVMLVFFPGAFSSTCTRELCEIRDDFRIYEQRGVTVLGISVDSTHALRAWRQDQGYRNRFLSDRWPVGAVAKLFGVWDEDAGQADRGRSSSTQRGSCATRCTTRRARRATRAPTSPRSRRWAPAGIPRRASRSPEPSRSGAPAGRRPACGGIAIRRPPSASSSGVELPRTAQSRRSPRRALGLG